MENQYQVIFNAVINGDAALVKNEISTALIQRLPVEEILNRGLIDAMKEVGRLFEEGEYFVPEMLISARAMQTGMGLLRPILVENDIKPAGKIVIGTVQGDLHDIGKNLVGMMLEGAGFQVIDLGTDVPPDKFIEAVKTHHPDIVGMSALLTTTMVNMEKTIRAFEASGIRDQVKIIIGGAPVTRQWAETIGADGFSSDASQAAVVAKALMAQ